MSSVILWLSIYVIAKWWTETRQSMDPPVCEESRRSLNPTESSRTGCDTKYARKWKHQPGEVLCLSAFLNCEAWWGIWLCHTDFSVYLLMKQKYVSLQVKDLSRCTLFELYQWLSLNITLSWVSYWMSRALWFHLKLALTEWECWIIK